MADAEGTTEAAPTSVVAVLRLQLWSAGCWEGGAEVERGDGDG
jgi:hypothetical protein